MHPGGTEADATHFRHGTWSSTKISTKRHGPNFEGAYVIDRVASRPGAEEVVQNNYSHGPKDKNNSRVGSGIFGKPSQPVPAPMRAPRLHEEGCSPEERKGRGIELAIVRGDLQEDASLKSR